MNGTICAPPFVFCALGIRSFCIQMVGLCATMKYGTICARYIEALSWRKWVAICVAETYFFFGLFLEPVYVFFLYCYYLFVHVMFFFVILLICLSVLF